MSEHNSRLMSIGEVAKSLHITRRMILNYADKGILKQVDGSLPMEEVTAEIAKALAVEL